MSTQDTSRDTTLGQLDLSRPPDTEALRALGRECVASRDYSDLVRRAGRELIGAAFVIEQLWERFMHTEMTEHRKFLIVEREREIARAWFVNLTES